MRNLILSAFVVGAITAGAAAPASAIDYPYCAQGRSIGIPGDCSYTSYEQCVASASGRGLSCNINPRAAFGRQGYRAQVYGGPVYDETPYRERRPARRTYREY